MFSTIVIVLKTMRLREAVNTGEEKHVVRDDQILFRVETLSVHRKHYKINGKSFGKLGSH
jgi:hypothetical protein